MLDLTTATNYSLFQIGMPTDALFVPFYALIASCPCIYTQKERERKRSGVSNGIEHAWILQLQSQADLSAKLLEFPSSDAVLLTAAFHQQII